MKVNLGGTSIPNLFHISSKNLNGVVLTPRVPDNEFVKWRVEDSTTKRVSFARSIGKCLTGLGRNLLNQEFYVFTPDMEFTSEKTLKENIIFPTRSPVWMNSTPTRLWGRAFWISARCWLRCPPGRASRWRPRSGTPTILPTSTPRSNVCAPRRSRTETSAQGSSASASMSERLV